MRIESSVLYSQVHRVTRLRFILRKQGSGALEGHPERRAIELCILRFYNTFQYKSVPRRFKKLVLTKRYIYIYTRLNQRVKTNRFLMKDARSQVRRQASLLLPTSYINVIPLHSTFCSISITGREVVTTLINRLRFPVQCSTNASW